MSSVDDINSAASQPALIPAEALATRWGVREDDCEPGEPEWSVWGLIPDGAGYVELTEDTARKEARHRYGSVTLVRRTGDGPIETVPYEPARLPAPTRDDPCWTIVHGIPLIGLGEDVDYIVAPGEQDRAAFAAAATEFRNDLWSISPDSDLQADDAAYRLATRHEAWGYYDYDDGDWVMRWPTDPPYKPTDPDVFWITVIDLHS